MTPRTASIQAHQIQDNTSERGCETMGRQDFSRLKITQERPQKALLLARVSRVPQAATGRITFWLARSLSRLWRPVALCATLKTRPGAASQARQAGQARQASKPPGIDSEASSPGAKGVRGSSPHKVAAGRLRASWHRFRRLPGFLA